MAAARHRGGPEEVGERHVSSPLPAPTLPVGCGGMSGFYEDLGDGRYRSTPATAGPWDAASQHGGPPSALLARAIERCEPQPAQRLARLSVDILRPVPVAELVVEAHVVRAGRRVTLVDAVASCDGQAVVRAGGWRIERASEPTPPEIPLPYDVPAVGEEMPPSDLGGFDAGGYLASVEWRAGRGSLRKLGPADVWARARLPLIDGEEASPMSRVALLADSGSGVSATLEATRWLFINVDLTLSLTRDPEGEWILLGSRTAVEPSGTGTAQTIVCDRSGPLGLAVQTLLVARR